jgi:hypothetical protein
MPAFHSPRGCGGWKAGRTANHDLHYGSKRAAKPSMPRLGGPGVPVQHAGMYQYELEGNERTKLAPFSDAVAPHQHKIEAAAASYANQ